MTTSDMPDEAYVWVWLPEATEPVVAGRVWRDGELFWFTYGRNYLDRANAMPLYLPELPLIAGTHRPLGAMAIAGCLRDAGPDAWGQRLILARHGGGLDSHDAGELERPHLSPRIGKRSDWSP